VADLKVVDRTVTFGVVASTVAEFGLVIENHPGGSLNGRVEFNVDRIFEHLLYYAFPAVDIGFDHVRDRSAFVIEVATDGYQISDLKLGGIDTPDFGLGINSENAGEQVVFDSDGIGSTRNDGAYIDGVRISQIRPDT
jgi:hypothetical protein